MKKQQNKGSSKKIEGNWNLSYGNEKCVVSIFRYWQNFTNNNFWLITLNQSFSLVLALSTTQINKKTFLKSVSSLCMKHAGFCLEKFSVNKCMLKVSNRPSEKAVKYVSKVNNQETRMPSMTSFTIFFGVYFIDFEQVKLIYQYFQLPQNTATHWNKEKS